MVLRQQSVNRPARRRVPGAVFRRSRACRFECLESRHLLAAELVGQVVINELHVDPDVKTELVEFIELHNRANAPVDLSGWRLEGVDFVFPQGTTIPAGGYAAVTQNAEMFTNKFQVPPVGQFAGTLSNEGETIRLRTPDGELIDQVDFRLGYPWPTVGDAPGNSMQLLDPALENDLGGSWRSALPTPGAANSVLTDNAPPQTRKVEHTPSQPKAGQPVSIAVKVTDPDGVSDVSLAYQVVEPGRYIALMDPEYQTQWTTLAMRDDGTAGDAVARDSIFTVIVPGDVQQHRRLIRYRISAQDARGAAVTVPYPDDPQPNFAYFIYDGVPSWTGSVRPGREPEVIYDFNQLGNMPVYHLISKHQDVVDAQYHPGTTRRSGYTGSGYLWSGTLVYDGKVYDHIRYRTRGGVWRYAMGKNMWKFDFNRGHGFQAKDDYGRPYDTDWDKLNFSAIIQQGDYLHRGEQGLFESVGFKLFNLAGVPAPLTHFVHFRVIDDAQESGSSQYDTDFWGMYLAVEQPDGKLLDQHGLPDGNLYKIENYSPETNNQGPTQVSNRSDVREFINTYRRTNPEEQWWRDNLDLDSYYSYRSIVEAIHHYDIAYGKNYFYYHDPDTNKFKILPWDIDLTWANNMYGDGNHDFKRKVADNPAFRHEYRNRMREIRDLLYNPEQAGMLIDEFARFIYTPGQSSWVDADRAMWDYNPILISPQVNSSKAGQGRFYRQARTRDFPGMMQIMNNYVVSRGNWIDTRILNDEDQIPERPTLTYVGAPGFPVDQLVFQTSDYVDPQGDPFAAIQWRVAEITDPSAPNFDPTKPRSYEITATWESGDLTEWAPQMHIPGAGLDVGKTYRARVRVKDSGGRWSHWSQPIQFVTQPALSTDLQQFLRIAEVHYNPGEPTSAERASGFNDQDRFEFIELVNIGPVTLDLSGGELVRATGPDGDQGVAFRFADGAITQLEPGGRVVVVEDLDAFAARYGNSIPVAGAWQGRLGNGGETLGLAAFGQTFLQFAYDDDWYPQTDGDGYSLVVVDPANQDLSSWNRPSAWRASAAVGGSPGTAEIAAPQGDLTGDGRIDAADIDRLYAALRAGDAAKQFDLNNDLQVDRHDVDHLVRNILNADYGDTNLDGVFDSADLVRIFQIGEFEDAVARNSTWADGDWNGDGDFDTGDLVLAFQSGRYKAG